MLIVCCGMIRSGSTLQYNLVRSLVEATASGVGEGFINEPLRDHRLRRWCWDKAWHVVKMHRIVDWMLEEQARKSIRFFFCHRNLHDVAASAKRKFGISSLEIWQRIDEAIVTQRHLQGSAEAQVQRYTELTGDPPVSLAAIAKFLDLPLSDQVRSEIVTSCSLDSAQKIQAAVCDMMSARGITAGKEEKISIFDQTTLLHHNHISSNRGRDDAWHSDLTAIDLHMIDSRYRQWLLSEDYVQA